jgi:hypothetical protein
MIHHIFNNKVGKDIIMVKGTDQVRDEAITIKVVNLKNEFNFLIETEKVKLERSYQM